VSMAVALNAEKCDIYTDVPGVYDADPKKSSEESRDKNSVSKKIDTLTYDEMINFVNNGANVMELRAVKLAQQHGLTLEVLSSFENVSGTVIS
ncbi:MAG: aspartate kinase, partial [Sphingomonadales bacterium]|nr:aspartate kinase [Sphingomonadales bacterium]